MADDIPITPGTGASIATDDIGGRHFQRFKPAIGVDGTAVDVSASNPMPVSGPVTDAQLRATPVPVSGSLTDAELRAAAVPVSGPVTDTQLRAAAVPVSGPLTDAQLRAAAVPVSGPLTDAQLRASAVTVTGSVAVAGIVEIANDSGSAIPISASALPLPTDAATQTTLAALSAKVPALATTVPDNNASGIPIRTIGQDIWVASFSSVGASVIDPQMTTPIVGTGVGYSQANGSLLVTTGTTTNAELLTRSLASWRGSWMLRFSTVLSQRIANQNFAVLLADLIGEALACTINSATSISVTLTAHGFTAQNVGQFMLVGGIAGAAGVPGRYAIASIPDSNTINFTVAGWPASGSCTLTLFGHSYVRHLFNGTTATAMAADAQRRGWATGDSTLTINTTAAPGTIVQTHLDGRSLFWGDMLRATSATPNITTRGHRVENLPDDNRDLYLFLWSYNGTSAPATTTTWTVSFAAVEKFANLPVYVQGQRMQGTQAAAPMTVVGTATVTFTQPALVAGTAAIGDVGLQYRANATGAATSSPIMSGTTTASSNLKNGAGRIAGLYLQNSSAAVRSVKIFNAVAPTMGTTAAAFEIDIPAGGVASLDFPGGLGFATALSWAVTSAKGLTDNTATGLAANDVTGFIAWA
jgi:hypothetical protein